MNLPLHQILPSEPVPLFVQHVSPSSTASTTVLASCSASTPPAGQTATPVRLHSLWPLATLRISERCPPNVRAVHPYGSSNLLFLVLGGARGVDKGKAREGSTSMTHSKAAHRVALWDDKAEQVLVELTFKEPVKKLVTRPDKLVIVQERRVIIYHLELDNADVAEAIVREGEYETANNPLGLASIATTVGSTMLAFPGRQVGHVQLIRLPRLRDLSEPSRPPQTRPEGSISAAVQPPYPSIHIFLAHESALRTLTLSSTGSLLCTSSSKGTLLRVFSTLGKTLVRELRRGTDQADVWSAAFLHPDTGELVACASDKRTVHVWKVGDLSAAHGQASSHQRIPGQPSSSSSTSAPSSSSKSKGDKAFGLLKPYLPAYFSSSWSDLSWRIPHNASVTFHPAHVAALAEQDDIATCFFVRSEDAAKAPMSILKASSRRNRKRHGNDEAQSKEKEKEESFYLLVITRSGAWYKLSTSPGPEASSHASSTNTSTSARHASTVKNATQENKENIPAKTGGTLSTGKEEDGKQCRLVEYRRIGYGTDGEESDSEEEEDELPMAACESSDELGDGD